MKRMLLVPALLATSMLLGGCGTGAPAPDPSDLARDDVFVLSLPNVNAQESLDAFDYDQQAPLDIQEVGSSRQGNVTSYDVTYASPRGGRVPAYVIVPDGRGPFAGIILMHGGALTSSRDDFSWVGTQYARHGAVVVVVDAPWNRPEHGPGTGPPRYSPTPHTFTEHDREEQI